MKEKLMERNDLDYLNDMRTAVEQGRPASADAVGELLRIVDGLRQTISEVSAARDTLKAWQEAVPVLEVDTVLTDAYIRKMWPQRGTIIAAWLDTVRDDFQYLPRHPAP